MAKNTVAAKTEKAEEVMGIVVLFLLVGFGFWMLFHHPGIVAWNEFRFAPEGRSEFLYNPVPWGNNKGFEGRYYDLGRKEQTVECRHGGTCESRLETITKRCEPKRWECQGKLGFNCWGCCVHLEQSLLDRLFDLEPAPDILYFEECPGAQ